MLPTLMRRRSHPLLHAAFDPFPDFFDRALDRAGDAAETSDVYGAYPVDIHEDDTQIYVEAELPGFTSDQIDVTLDSGVLSIAAQRDEKPEREGTTHLAQRRFTRVNRRFSMPDSVDEQNVEAKLEHGVLHLTLAKRPEVQPRKIEVK